MAVERKYERDIDILLAEEFAVNPSFAEQFKALTKFASGGAAVEDVWVSKSNNLGESDLIVLYRASDAKRFALLIEDKVDAPLQPVQAHRYRLRAERERAAGVYDEYEILLCAPRHYIDSRSDLGGFDRIIAYEEIADLLEQPGDARAQYKSSFLRTAGTKRINTWSREDDAATNAFWDAAYAIAAREFPQLEMKPLKLTKNSSWINFRPRDFPTQPKRVYISFKGDRGQIDLTFSNTIMHRLAPQISGLLEAGMTLHQTRASTAIRLQTDGFRVADGPVRGELKVRKAFEASVKLIAFYRRFRVQLDVAAGIATPQ
ncbi:MAG TPA: hypothetical protein VG889_11465 [Rhizomicrobium sp.]|nr:hypothetical protein [Rhizomicrobium sp.]